MAYTAMTRVQTRSAIVLLLVVTLVGVQGRPYPEDFTFSNQPQTPTYPFWRHRNIPTVPTHVESQATNLDESQFWASTQNTQDAGRFTRPREGLTTNEYNYAMEDTNKRSEEFFTPEMLSRINAYNELQLTKFDREMQSHMTPEELARVKAFNEAQQANFNREMQSYDSAKTTTTTGKNEYPKMLPDGTELLWVTGPQKETPEELARLNALMGNPKATATLAGSQQNKVQSSTDAPVFDVDSSNWEDGPWGTKHRPGAEHSLEYVGFEQPDGTTVTVPHSFNNP